MKKKGFNVLAFESDFYALTKGWDELPKEKRTIDSFLRKNVYGIWTKCDACAQLFYNYIPHSFQTDSPIQITGFDNQLLNTYSTQLLSKKLDSLLKTVGLKDSKIVHTVDTLLASFISYNGEKINFYKEVETKLHYLKSIIETRLPNNTYWVNITKSLIALNWRAIYSPQNGYNVWNIERDKQMAENLKWLVDDKYKKEKIIVWAANAHIVNYKGKIVDQKFHKYSFQSMGSFFMEQKNIPETYILGFTSYSGSSKWVNQKEATIVDGPKKNSLETWIGKDFDYGFVDFNTYNQKINIKGPFYMNTQLFGKSIKHDWNRAYNGIFFIREMYGCNPLP